MIGFGLSILNCAGTWSEEIWRGFVFLLPLSSMDYSGVFVGITGSVMVYWFRGISGAGGS